MVASFLPSFFPASVLKAGSFITQLSNRRPDCICCARDISPAQAFGMVVLSGARISAWTLQFSIIISLNKFCFWARGNAIPQKWGFPIFSWRLDIPNGLSPSDLGGHWVLHTTSPVGSDSVTVFPHSSLSCAVFFSVKVYVVFNIHHGSRFFWGPCSVSCGIKKQSRTPENDFFRLLSIVNILIFIIINLLGYSFASISLLF